MKKKSILFALFVSLFFNPAYFSFAQIPVPAPPQTKKILLLNGTAHLGNGSVIENSAIAFEGGKLTLVADATKTKPDVSRYDEVIQIQGKHVYPGIIAPNSTLGITEIDAARATRDFNDVGLFIPHVRSIIAYNAESRIIPTVRSNGVLLAQVTPRGGLVSGTSSVVELDAWNWEDAVYKIDDGIHINWPGMFQRTGWWAEPGQVKKNEKQKEQVEQIRKFLLDAKAYCDIKNQEEKNLRFEAMRNIFEGTKTMFIHVDIAKEIIQSVSLIRDAGVKKIVVVGGYDAWRVTDFLKENNIPVMLKRVHSLPDRPDDDVNLPYKLPFILKKAGLLFCLENSGDMEAMNARNLPFLAGTAAAYGLTKEEALMAITSNTAMILGIDNTVGTLETGKDATLFISTGDALDIRTNNVEHVFIRGKKIDADNHQKALYRKYRAKYKYN